MSSDETRSVSPRVRSDGTTPDTRICRDGGQGDLVDYGIIREAMRDLECSAAAGDMADAVQPMHE